MRPSVKELRPITDSLSPVAAEPSYPPSQRLPTGGEVQHLEKQLLASGVNVADLMERAGRGVVDRTVAAFPYLFGNQHLRVAVLCGPGNNGADGFVIARALRRMRILPEVFVVAAERYSTELLQQLSLFCGESGFVRVVGDSATAASLGVKHQFLPVSECQEILSRCQLIFDGLLGSSQSAPPRGPVAALVEIVSAQQSSAKLGERPVVVSVDIPTGVSPDSGEVFSPHISADLTVSMQWVKRGMMQSPAFECCGLIRTVDIGIPDSEEVRYTLLSELLPPALLLRQRSRSIHKGQVGRVLVIGGSASYPGAPVLCAQAALRSGAGLVWVAAPSATLTRIPLECIPIPLQESAGILGVGVAEQLLSVLPQFSSVAVGPGLSLDPRVREMLARVLPELARLRIATVVDADALSFLVGDGAPVIADWGSFVLTPHAGEAARLLGTTAAEVQRDRYSAAERIASLFPGATVILKGAGSIIFQGEHGYVLAGGNPFMATAGSGDVLTGVSAAMLAISPGSLLTGATQAAFLHASAGDIAHATHGGPIIASDIISAIPEAYGRLSHRG